MNYEQRYKEILEAVKELQEDNPCDDGINKWVEDKFPELRESEDETVRKKIIATIHLYYGEPLEDEAKQMLVWLEKQRQKPACSETFIKKACEWLKDNASNYVIEHPFSSDENIEEDEMIEDFKKYMEE